MTREQLVKHWDVIQAFKEGKEIQYRKIGTSLWESDNDEPNFGFYDDYEYRVKPEPTKRLPTIDEVKEWFMENRVFIRKVNKCFYRIDAITLTSILPINVQNKWISIENFCEIFTNVDGTSLLIEEV